MTYTFTCPLEGCGLVMTTNEENMDAAAKVLVATAKEHLATVHPDVRKTDDEVNTDIMSHMVKVGE